MFKVFLTNFGFFLQSVFDNVDEAIQYGRNCGFDYVVYEEDKLIYCNGQFFNDEGV